MIQLISEKTPEQLEAEFYSKKHRFSYSGISKLLFDPRLWYRHYILKQKEDDKAKHLTEGSVIHSLLLEKEKFDQNYIISPDNLPEGNLKTVVDKVFQFRQSQEGLVDVWTYNELSGYDGKILEIMKEMSYFQALVDDKPSPKKPDGPVKTGDEKRLEKILVPAAINYWEFLIKKGTKTLIDQSTYDYCSKAVELMKKNAKITDLLGLGVSTFDDIDIYNEELLEADLEQYQWGIKGGVDNIKVDHTNMVIYINDVKTTGKELGRFLDSVEYFKYFVQAAIYYMLVKSKFADLIERGYSIQFHFIVADINLHTYAFPVSETTLLNWVARTEEIFSRADYHYSQKRFSLPYEFDLGLVEL